MTRRDFLARTGAAAAAAALTGCATFGMGKKRRLALNAATIRDYRLPLKEQVRLAIAAGYNGYEPWLRDVHAAVAAGELADIAKMAADNDFHFVNGIAFGTWAHPDAKTRREGIEETKRDMAVLQELGCPCIAASMFGLHRRGAPRVTGDDIAEFYAALLDLGTSYGVRPLLEYWGHSATLFRLEQAMRIVRQTKRADAGLIVDVYHTWRGGSSFAALKTCDPAWLPIVHVNDYPANLARQTATDKDRIWPGDGAAPWREIFDTLDALGASSWLSLELFNAAYCSGPVEAVLETGLAKMKAL